jgi:hypothetical protein
MLVGQLFATCFYFLAINVAYIVSDFSTKAHKGIRVLVMAIIP